VAGLRVVGLVLWAWAIGAAGAALAILWRPRGFYLRWVQWAAQITCLIMAVWIWTPAAGDDGFWWQNASLEAGIVTVGGLAVLKRRHPFSKRKRRDVPIAAWRWMWDYSVGLFAYLVCIYAMTAVAPMVHAAHGAADVIGAEIGYFVAAQLTTAGVLRVLHASISEDYGLRRGAHYVLAVILVLAALGLVVALGGSVASYVFSLLVLAVGWRFTEEQPNATLKIVRSVARQLCSGFCPERLRPDTLPAESSPASASGSPTPHSHWWQGRKGNSGQR
jgi:hypothetical protein